MSTNPAECKPRSAKLLLLLARVEQVADTINYEAGKLAAVLSDESRMVCSLRAQVGELRAVMGLLKGGES
jgi:hypothetical protein